MDLLAMFTGNQVGEVKKAAANGRAVTQSSILESLKTILSKKRTGSVLIERGDLELNVSVQ